LLALAAHARDAAAQQEELLGAGARIRLWSNLIAEQFLVGRLLDLEQRSLTVVPTGDTVLTLPLDSIRRLDLSIGRNKTVIAASIVVGAALGAVLVPALTNDPAVCEFGYEESSACATETPDVLIGLAAGAIGGLIVSGPLAPERWARVRLDLLLRDGTVRIERGLALSVALSF
jgi:hypothetical protein